MELAGANGIHEGIRATKLLSQISQMHDDDIGVVE
jgi:hypothetical protein